MNEHTKDDLDLTLLYNKYRPKTFRDVVGQDHITSILKGIVHRKTYKFVKSVTFGAAAGSGKTTSSRIFAKAINCTDNIKGEPCNKCENCVKFDKGQYADFIEIDAASYNKTEDMDFILTLVRSFPSNSKGYKIILMDEAHRLSNAAWDKLLKELEEGKNKTIMMFATTEIEKIRDAIRSRSLNFKLKLLSSEEIFQQLKYICDKEGMAYDTSSLRLLSHYYKGKTRQAISALDTFRLAYGEVKNIQLDVVEDYILDLLRLAYFNKSSEVQKTVDKLSTLDFDVRHSLSNVLNDLKLYPNIENSILSEQKLVSTLDLLGNSLDKIINDFLKFRIDNIDSMKLFLNIVSTYGIVSDTTKTETVKRRFINPNDTKPSNNSITKKVVDEGEDQPSKKKVDLPSIARKYNFRIE